MTLYRRIKTRYSNMPRPGKILKILLLCILVLIFLLLTLTGIFLLKKDDISSKILLTSNKTTSGELQFNSVRLNFFAHFPDVSLTLTEPQFFENKTALRDSTEQPIIRLSEIHIALNIADLLRKKINITAVSIEDGEINLKKYPDNGFNILKAIEPEIEPKDITEKIKPSPKQKATKIVTKKDTTVKKTKKAAVKKKSEPQTPDIDLLIDKISVKRVSVNYFNIPDNNYSSIYIKKLGSSFSYFADSVDCKIKTAMKINLLPISDDLAIHNKSIELKTEFGVDLQNQLAYINPSKLDFENAIFSLFGTIGFQGEMPVNINIEGYDNDLSVLNLFLSQKGVRNIKKGSVAFRGSVTGMMHDRIPGIELTFDVDDLLVDIPRSKNSIRNLNFRGKFISGTDPDFSEAYFTVDTLHALLPDGYINARCAIRNFIDPETQYLCKIKSNVEGLEKVFKLHFIKSLKGHVIFSDSYQGQYIQSKGWVDKYYNNLSLKLENLSFEIPGVMEVENLSGDFSGDPDTLNLRGFKLLTGNTDIAASGKIINLTELLFDRQRDIQAILKLESDTYDLPEFLKFNPRIGQSFPYKIRNIGMDLKLTTSHKKLTEFKTVPEIRFEFDPLVAVIDQFLPPIEMRFGIFSLGEIESTLHLDFNELDIHMAGGDLRAEYDFYHPLSGSDTMCIKMAAKNLNPGKLIFNNVADSIPDALNNLLEGDFVCNITLPVNQKVLFKTFDLDINNLHYKTMHDTIDAKLLRLAAENILYDHKINSNPFATLSANIWIISNEFSSSRFKVDEIIYKIRAEKGVYIIVPEKGYRFGKEGRSEFVLSPFANTPEYKLKYSVKQFPVDVLLKNLQLETIIDGQANLDLDIQFKGNTKESIASTINGNVHIEGEDLKIYGVNLDDIINNFERSQKFNLVDVGALAVAGPAGLALTKGSDYARVLNINEGDSTRISKINTSLVVHNGFIEAEDVAFATNMNRIAVKGWYDLPSDSLDIDVGVLDEKGCSIITQTTKGNIKDPQQSKIRILKTLLAPVTNLLETTAGVECDAFYEGSVPHPDR